MMTTRKAKSQQQRERRRTKQGHLYDITVDHRFAVDRPPNGGAWMLIEEKRREGVWQFHRYATELPYFSGIEEAMQYAVEEAARRREQIERALTKADWIALRYTVAMFPEIPREFLPGRLPPGWTVKRIEGNDPHIGAYAVDQFHRLWDGLRVGLRYKVINDKRWLAVNASYGDEIPDHDVMSEVKSLFIGDGRHALMVYPRKEEHVNHSFSMLHLFTCIDAWPLPDFRSML